MLLNTRSPEKEYLDEEHIPTEALYLNLKELDTINENLGGYKASRAGLATLFKNGYFIQNLMDIGFGGGDFIRQLALFSKAEGKTVFFYGVDLKPDCVAYAAKNLEAFSNVKLICDDYRNISADLLKKTDVIHSSLFLHHLSNAEIVSLFRFARENKCMILANDLHRHWLAYSSIRFITALFSKSYLVKNDAPISVKRGFKKKELIALLKEAGFTNYSVRWSWAFRFIVTAIP
jgi:2-polyprenyl-3-methyl-5-hydroxy-6-metoxy-1,4-benzoquinol methylase